MNQDEDLQNSKTKRDSTYLPQLNIVLRILLNIFTNQK